MVLLRESFIDTLLDLKRSVGRQKQSGSGVLRFTSSWNLTPSLTLRVARFFAFLLIFGESFIEILLRLWEKFY